jgi:tetratricopeptide (TPR) repeat protein
MSRRYVFWGSVLAASSALVAGCGALSSRDEAPKSQVASARRDGASNSDSDAKRLAEAHAHYGAGVIHEMEDDSDAALQEYYQAALKDPENESLTLDISHRFLQKKQPDKALELLNRAAQRPEASGAVFARIGFIYSQQGKHDQAVAANRMAITKSPESLSGYQNLFLNYLQNKQTQEALKVLDEAGGQQSASFEFLVGLSELYLNFSVQVPAQKEIAHAKALAVLNRADKLQPPNPASRLQLADAFNLLGDTAKAAQLYLDLLKKLPDVPLIQERVRAKLTDIYLRGQDHKRAVEQLEAIIRDDPTNPQAYYFLGSIALDDKKLPEAAEHFHKTILLNPDFEQAYYDLAIAQINLNQTSDALATLGKARQRFPQGFVLEFLTGMAFSHQKAYAEALQHYTSAEVIAQATDPKRLNEGFYFQLGATYERKGDYEQAEKYFKKCLQLEPDSAETMNYLGFMWAEHGLHLEQARDLIEKAVKAEPKNAAYLDSLGWVRFKLGQPKEALEPVLKAAELSETPDATVYDHLGDIYTALNQMEKAREAWRKSLSLEPNEQVQKKLDAGAGKRVPL